MHSQFEPPDFRDNPPPSRGAEPSRPQGDAQKQRRPSGLEGLEAPATVRSKPPVIAFRANGIYETVLKQVQEELARLSPPVAFDLFIAPEGTPQQEVGERYSKFVEDRGRSDLLLYDRTTQAALKGTLPDPHQLNLDDIFGAAVRSMLLRQYGATFFLSPDECKGATAAARADQFLTKLRRSLPTLLGLGFRPPNPMPDQVVIFTEELSSHVPFWYVEQLGASPGELMRQSVIEAGVPADRITVVKNPDELLFNSDGSKDPFVELLRARYVALLGDRHVLAPDWVQRGIIRGLTQTLFEQLSLYKETQAPTKQSRNPNTKKPEDLLTASGDIDIQAGLVLALSQMLRPFGEAASARTARSGKSRVAWLRLPLENFLVDLTRHGLLDPCHAISPTDLIPGVKHEVLEILRRKHRIGS